MTMIFAINIIHVKYAITSPVVAALHVTVTPVDVIVVLNAVQFNASAVPSVIFFLVNAAPYAKVQNANVAQIAKIFHVNAVPNAI